MQIIHVCDRFTPRVAKMIIAQQGEGHGVMLVYKRDCLPGMLATVLSSSKYEGDAQLRQKLRMLAPGADVVWVHTSINSVQLAGDALRYLPPECVTVWDVHDYSNQEYSTTVTAIFDVVVCPSDGMVKRFTSASDGNELDVIRVYNKCPRAFGRVPPKQPVGNSMVLASGIERKGGTVWRDYTWLQEQCRAWGVQLFIYPGSVDAGLIHEYDNVMQMLPLWQMMDALSRYECGWAGAANDKHDIDCCVTNKFWEYLAAGIPPVTFNSMEMTEIAAELGFDVDDSEPFPLPQPAPRYWIHAAKHDGKVFLEDDDNYKALMRKLGDILLDKCDYIDYRKQRNSSASDADELAKTEV